MHLLVGIAVLAISLSYKLILYPTYLSPLAGIPPAHPLCIFTSLWIQWKRYRDQEFDAVSQAFRSKGPYLRLGPNEIAVNTIDGGVRKIYGFGRDNFDKSPWYDFFKNFGFRNTFSALGAEHTRHRRRVTSVYAKSFLQKSPHIKTILHSILSERITPILNQAASTNTPIDILPVNMAYGLDFVSAFIFGKSRGVNFLEDTKERDQWLDMYELTHPAKNVFWIQEYPRTAHYLSKLGLHLIPSGFLDAKGKFEQWAKERARRTEIVLQRQYTEAKDLSDGDMPLLYHQLKIGMAAEKGSIMAGAFVPNEAEQHELASECLDHLVATRDTFGITFSFVIYEISRHIDVQDALRKELLSIDHPFQHLKDHTLGDLPLSRTLESLPLLNAIIKESVRLRNTGPTLNPRRTPTGRDTTIGPWTNIPPGVQIGAFAWCLHRNEEAFPNAETWDPQRWLINENDPIVRTRDSWFWSFGSGSRQCLGQQLAMELMRFAIAAIYTNFRTTISDDKTFVKDGGFVKGDGSEQLILNIELVL